MFPLFPASPNFHPCAPRYQAKADAERRRTLQLSQQQQDAIAEEGETDEEDEGND